MLETDAGPRAVIFTMPPEAVATYRAWKLAADHGYIQAQLEQQGWASVVRLGDDRGLLRITAPPAPGEADPYYGDVGGGYPFVFRPSRGACQLTVTAPEISVWVDMREIRRLPPAAAPLELTVEPMALLDTPLETPGGQGVLDELPNDPARPWRFGIAGPLASQLIAQGWDRAVPAAYAYTFIPTNVGCVVRVADERSGAVIDLTADWDW